MTFGGFNTPRWVPTVQTEMHKLLAGETLGRVVGFESFNFDGHVEKGSFIVDLFAGRRGGENDHVK